MPVFSAEANPSTNAASRIREDRSAALTLALQAVQQLQTQQRATLQAVEEARQQSEAASRRYEQRVESLRHLLFALCAVVAIAISGTAYYVSSLVHKPDGQGQLSGVFKCPLPASAREPNATLHVATLLARGQALLEQRHPIDALACFEQAIAIDDSHADAYIGKGNVLNRLERYQEALACFERAAHNQHYLHAVPQAASASL